MPLMCSARRGQRCLYATIAYVGEPPVRSGIIAESSARSRQSRYPVIVMTTICGIAAAPNDVTMTGAIPVTRIVPARPITNAPRQLVSLRRPPPATSAGASLADAIHPPSIAGGAAGAAPRRVCNHCHERRASPAAMLRRVSAINELELAIGAQIRSLRRDRGMTVVELAR